MSRRTFCRLMAASVGIGLLLAISACAPPTTSPQDVVKNYVDDAFAILETGIYAHGAKWHDEADQARQDLYVSPTISGTYRGLAKLAVLAGGRHSAFIEPAAADIAEDSSSPGTFATPEAKLDGSIAVLTLPSFNGTEDAAERYADAGVQAIQATSASATCGWIVDLRKNAGGNAFAMLAAVAPLLSNGPVAGFKDSEGEIKWISITDGKLPGFDTTPMSVNAAVVVLTSRYTASAAELVAVSFNSQPGARRVGEQTAGLTTSNVAHKLSDGATLIISTAWYVDRNGTTFTSALIPEDAVSQSPTVELDAAKQVLRRHC